MTDDRPQVRRRLLELVRAYPGLHLREAARQLETSIALVEYHAQALQRAGLLVAEEDQRFLRLHPATAPTDPADRAAIHTLRVAQGLHITLFLLDHEGPANHGTMAEALGMRKSTLSFHLRRLEGAGIVSRSAEGYALADPARVARLLRAHQPTPDMRERFARLWDSFYSSP